MSDLLLKKCVHLPSRIAMSQSSLCFFRNDATRTKKYLYMYITSLFIYLQMQLRATFVLFLLLIVHESRGASTCCDLCQCVDMVINCDKKDLADLPDCSGHDHVFNNLTIRDSNLTTATMSKVPAGISTVVLSGNKINNIALTALNNDIKSLNLRNNRLVVVPDLKLLPMLEELDVSGNPIPESGFHADIMRELGSNLKSIHIGDAKMFKTFPRTVSTHLQKLDTLDINGANPAFQYLTPNAFEAFASRLKKLTIRNTYLQAIPLTLHTARNLEEFHFDGNPIGDYGVLAESFTGLNHLKVLTLRNDEIRTFPEIVDHLDVLTTFALDGNVLLYIREDAFDMIDKSNIVDLSLANCSLDRIPGAVTGHTDNYLAKIQKLNFADNNIQSIDRNDLKNLNSLQFVSFAGNPLQYISSEAFTGMPNLMKIDFSNTNLQVVPEAIKHVPNIENIVLSGTDVACTCDLVDFKQWIRRCFRKTLTFEGHCETIDSTLQHYLEKFVPACPLFNVTLPRC